MCRKSNAFFPCLSLQRPLFVYRIRFDPSGEKRRRDAFVRRVQGTAYTYNMRMYRKIPLTRYKLMAAGAVTKASLRFLNCSEHMAMYYIYIIII